MVAGCKNYTSITEAIVVVGQTGFGLQHGELIVAHIKKYYKS